ncbi:metal ABC transporter substrate-binding protein [Lederbergia wuyishanensis]|uniref:Zinc transport system substrate-binding protein n=1 Tax=Lederbergia wuyishanensis TaxID=1347903 RepID=A0ABU0D7L6_9BACI|nr:metal ABC transporter substrate-binding protein [Lederbergia wuyishanensis]MCJ8009054.1 metal ABC transporter substrate-binding protein [Lederbergia wuyishanensis]MDQ0344389.1 zinc transport system substrate-binding protein [Lederbergia wuyishanensis]
MKIQSILLTIFLLTAAFLSGCNTNSPNKKDQATNKNDDTILTVFTTIYPIEDFTKRIGGKHVEVKSVYPAGADAHTFEPTMRTMMDIADADLFIFNGAGLEPFIDKTKSSLANEKVTMVEASNGIELLSGNDDHDEADHNDNKEEEQDHHHHGKDPHIWLDPVHAIKMAENIKDALTEVMPSAEDDFEKNFIDVKQELEKLDKEFKKTVDSADHKEILVSHSSYGYWEHRYGLKQISISGLSPENEPSQKQLQTIIETAKKHNISYIIYDQNPVTKVADVVKKETETTPVTLHNLEYLTENDIKNNEDYFTIMNKNIETLKKVLAK